MKVFDDGVLQSLLNSVILGCELFLGASVIVIGTYFVFQYLRGKNDGKG
jgi:hypothetical protein